MTTLTIHMDIDLETLKEMYRDHMGLPQDERVTKKQIAIWIATLALSDLQ